MRSLSGWMAALALAALASAAQDGAAALVRQARLYLQQMRETTDYGLASKAQQLVDKALADGPASPAFYPARQVQVELHLVRHEFRRVIALSRQLIEERPRDAVNYATLGDALMERGEYEAAAGAYQKMVDRQAGLMSYNRIGWWRFVNGDLEGAIEMMRRAVRSGRPNHEHTAWCLVELGNLYRKAGRLPEAAQTYNLALEVFPKMHSALAGLGQTAAAQGRMEEAIGRLQQAQALAPMVEYAGQLADWFAVAGRTAEAERQLALVDLQAKLEAASGQKANRQIALIYANHNRRLDQALDIAAADLAVRQDVFTWDAYAWVLHRMGRNQEARLASLQALRAQTPDPMLHYHAAVILSHSGDAQAALREVETALKLNPHFGVREAPQARQLRQRLQESLSATGAPTGAPTGASTTAGPVQ